MSGSGYPNQDEIQKEKEKFLTMPLDMKRKHYKSSKFHTVDKIDTWQDFHYKSKERLEMQFSGTFGDTNPFNSCSVDPELNTKVSIWEGNIIQLEVDAIVTSANPDMSLSGGVYGAVHAAGGVYLTAECATLGRCEKGDAKITGGYRLPAKYVIHTVGAIGENPDILESCYRSSLDLLVEQDLRTVAFLCIATGVLGYPKDKAAHVVLKTVRTFLELNRDSIDRIIFCLFMKEDVKIYENLMQVYFPVGDMNK